MYSVTIKPKVDKMFEELRKKADEIVLETNSANDAVNEIAYRVGSETATRSKEILSDMLFDLSDALMNTSFFADVSRQNRFTEINLRKEILGKYQFEASAAVDYKEAARIVQALKLCGGVLVIGGIGEIGIVLIKGLSLSSLIPVPIGILVAAALGVALADYFVFEPNKNRKNFKRAVDNYLAETQQQFLNWFDEVENYYNKRVDEIKRTI